MNLRQALLCISGIILFASCSYDKEIIDPCENLPATFATDVLPIIQTKCATAQCHGTGSTNLGGPLTNYTQIQNKAQRIREAVQTGYMPKSGTLTHEQINTISCWVQSGAQNN